ncbi:MAG TPA: CBS domain-containing protein [Elusimicrobiota bacterium]|nr:CBS domain-containing protein [Elusimicrobiota bacterium]
MSEKKLDPATAADVMSPEVIAINENDDVWSAIRILVANDVTGAPVVGADGRLVGVISQTDLVRYLQAKAAKLADFYSDSEPDARLPTNGRSARVQDLMTRRIIKATEDDSLDKISRIMLVQKVHRVIITRAERLVGIVTTMDVLRAAQHFGGRAA